MIPLFHIPHHVIDTSKFTNLLTDKVVKEFEQEFAAYVGAKYAVSFNSACSGIFLTFLYSKDTHLSIPSILPPVVLNQLQNAGVRLSFNDNINWVGHSYLVGQSVNGEKFIDSAQRVDYQQYANECKKKDMMLFSFFPTKPVGGANGGMIVSDNEEVIETLRERANNGMRPPPSPLDGEGLGMRRGGAPSWEMQQTSIGFKMSMDTIPAYIALQNLRNLDNKKHHLDYVRQQYNEAFGLNNTSHHLYRVPVFHNKTIVERAAKEGIQCGIHYLALHHNPIFEYAGDPLPKSDEAASRMVSIPFNEALTTKQINTVIEFVKRNR